MTTSFSNKVKAYRYRAGKRGRFGSHKSNWPGRLYKKLATLETTTYIIGIMAIFYALATIFPPGLGIDEYATGGGRFVLLVRVLGLLDFFTSPIFLFLVFVLVVNLVLYAYDKFLLRVSKKTPSEQFEPTSTIQLTQEKVEAAADVRGALVAELGFKTVRDEGGWTVLEKGVPHRTLSVFYHAALVVFFLGIALTYLFAYEETITLAPEDVYPVSPTATGRLPSLLDMEPSKADFLLVLDKFGVEYTEHSNLEYPELKTSRLAPGTGWQGPRYTLGGDSFFTADPKSSVRVVKGGLTVAEKTITLNEPLKYGGYTFYQTDFVPKLRLRVGNNPISLVARAGETLMLPGLNTSIQFSSLRSGTLHRLDGTTTVLTPSATLSVMPSIGSGAAPRELGKLELGESVSIGPRRIKFIGFEEDSVLSYRYDPGVPVLRWAAIFVLITMSVRLFGTWYRVAYRLGEEKGIVFVDLDISTRGLAANQDKLVSAVEHHLTRNDIIPVPL